MAGPPTPPPGTGRWAVVAVLLAFLLVGAGVLLTRRPAPIPVKVSPEPPAAAEQPIATTRRIATVRPLRRFGGVSSIRA